jgi:hypothetical protein
LLCRSVHECRSDIGLLLTQHACRAHAARTSQGSAELSLTLLSPPALSPPEALPAAAGAMGPPARSSAINCCIRDSTACEKRTSQHNVCGTAITRGIRCTAACRRQSQIMLNGSCARTASGRHAGQTMVKQEDTQLEFQNFASTLFCSLCSTLVKG